MATRPRSEAPFEGENWSAGEMAECRPAGGGVDWADPQMVAGPGPSVGEVYRVLAVTIELCPWDRVRVCALTFSRWPDLTFDSREFRKIEPRADRATPAADAFIAQLRHLAQPAHAGAR